MSKERAIQEVLNSGCVNALLTCLSNIKNPTKSTVCIFDCFRAITPNDSVKLDFVRHDGVATVSRHLVELLDILSKPYSASDEEMYASAANQCVCTFLEICNIDLARSQFASMGLHQFLREFTAVPQTGKTAMLHANTGENVQFGVFVLLCELLNAFCRDAVDFNRLIALPLDYVCF